MKKSVPFIVVFFFTQLLLIFCHIYASSTYMSFSYRKQNSEKLLAQLSEQKNELHNRLAELRALSAVKAAARERGMVPCRLKNMKRLNQGDTYAVDAAS